MEDKEYLASRDTHLHTHMHAMMHGAPIVL